MNYSAIYALVLRYIYIYRRNKIRLFELFFWPFMHLLVWGNLTAYLQQSGGGELPHFIAYLLGGMLLWDVLFRAQHGVAISFLEDIWTRNLLNIYVAPVRTVEMLISMFILGVLRVAFTVPIMAVLAFIFYKFNIFVLNPLLIPYFAILLLFGWVLGIIANALVIRWGQGAEGLAWAIPFMIQPFAAVFYPVSILPSWLHGVAWSLPCTHIFEGMRASMRTGAVEYSHILWATGITLVWMAVALAIFGRTLRHARNSGLLTKVASH